MVNQQPLLKLVVSTVYDSKVRQYLEPMFTKTTEEAIRAFGAAAKSEKHNFNQFAEDFTLWQIGVYYPETGLLESSNRIQISSAAEFKN